MKQKEKGSGGVGEWRGFASLFLLESFYFTWLYLRFGAISFFISQREGLLIIVTSLPKI